MKERISFIFAVSLLILTVLACGQLRKNATRSSEPDFEISVEQLAKEFKENGTAADFKYSGMTLAITGRVFNTLFESAVIFDTDDNRDGFAVQCNLDKDAADPYKKIARGKEVTLVGVCRGRDGKSGPLIITQCILR